MKVCVERLPLGVEENKDEEPDPPLCFYVNIFQTESRKDLLLAQQASVCENSSKVINPPEEHLSLAHLCFSDYSSACFYFQRLQCELLLPFFAHGSSMCASA